MPGTGCRKMIMKRALICLFAFLYLGAISLRAAPAAAGGVPWIYDWEQAVRLAKQHKKLIVLDLYTDWCTWCRVMEVNTYGDPSVVRELGPRYIWLKLNAETEEDGRKAQRRFRVMGYPATLLIEPEEGLYEKTSGYLNAEQFREEISRHQRSLQSVTELRDRVRREPESADLKLELAVQYMQRRHYPGAEKLYRELIEAKSMNQLDESYYSLAVTLAQQGKEREALETLIDLQNRFPESDLFPQTLAFQGEIHLNLGNRNEAIRIWRRCLKSFPNHELAERITERLRRIESG